MSKSTAKIETLVVFILLVVGLIGAIAIFRPSEDAFASPNHKLEHSGATYQISLEEPGNESYMDGLALD